MSSFSFEKYTKALRGLRIDSQEKSKLLRETQYKVWHNNTLLKFVHGIWKRISMAAERGEDGVDITLDNVTEAPIDWSDPPPLGKPFLLSLQEINKLMETMTLCCATVMESANVYTFHITPGLPQLRWADVE